MLSFGWWSVCFLTSEEIPLTVQHIHPASQPAATSSPELPPHHGLAPNFVVPPGEWRCGRWPSSHRPAPWTYHTSQPTAGCFLEDLGAHPSLSLGRNRCWEKHRAVSWGEMTLDDEGVEQRCFYRVFLTILILLSTRSQDVPLVTFCHEALCFFEQSTIPQKKPNQALPVILANLIFANFSSVKLSVNIPCPTVPKATIFTSSSWHVFHISWDDVPL